MSDLRWEAEEKQEVYDMDDSPTLTAPQRLLAITAIILTHYTLLQTSLKKLPAVWKQAKNSVVRAKS